MDVAGRWQPNQTFLKGDTGTELNENGTLQEMDGRIVLALSSTLWLQPLVERKRLEGSRAWIHVQVRFTSHPSPTDY